MHASNETPEPTPTPEADLEPWQAMQPTVEQAARSLMKAFRRWVELEDVVQSIWLYYFEHAAELDLLFGTRLAYVRLKAAGSKYAQKEMAYRIGLDYPAQYQYSRSEVKGLLEFALAGGLQGSEPQATICGWVDLQRGLADLGREGLAVLWHAYGPDLRDPLTATQRSVTSRTLSKLQQAMNTPLRLLQPT